MRCGWFIVLCLASFVFPVFAQETIVISVNTTPNILVRTVSTRQAQANTVIAAIQTASPIYFDVFRDAADFAIFVELVIGDRGAEAYAVTRKEIVDLPATTDGVTAPSRLVGRKLVCHMTFYNSPEFNREPALLHNIAHELAHCFQSFGVYEAGLASAETSPWWFEGTAEWMAGLVFPPTDSIIMSDMQRNFTTSMQNNLSLLDLDYTGSYFWRYVGWQMSSGNVGATIRNMPADADQPAYIAREVPFFADTLHAYALTLARNRIPAQPDVNRLFGTNKPSANAVAPSTINLPISPLGTQFITVGIDNLPDGQGV